MPNHHIFKSVLPPLVHLLGLPLFGGGGVFSGMVISQSSSYFPRLTNACTALGDIPLARSLSDLELYDSFPSSKRLKNDCYALIRLFIERFSTLMRLFLPFGQSYPASTWSRFKL
jgi:hypothetical protein